MMNDGGWMWGHGGGWVGWLMMWVLMLVFWGGLITAVVLGVRYLGASGQPRPVAGRRPEDLLAERYARGEIDDDEYRRRSALLGEHRVAS